MTKLLTDLDVSGVLTLTLNRPDVHNAFDAELIIALTEALTGAASNPDVRVVVLTGAGQSFSAGADVAWMRSMASATEEENERDALQLARLMRALNYLERPTVARINGAAYGGGVGLIACCDITITADQAWFGLTEARLGLAPAVISPYVFRRIGEQNARRYFQSGERFDARRASTIGLVQQVEPPGALDKAVSQAVGQVLKSGPQAAGYSKRLVFAIAGTGRDQQVRLDEYTARLIAQLRVSAEGQEGLTAFLDKRPPDWVRDTND